MFCFMLGKRRRCPIPASPLLAQFIVSVEAYSCTCWQALVSLQIHILLLADLAGEELDRGIHLHSHSTPPLLSPGCIGSDPAENSSVRLSLDWWVFANLEMNYSGSASFSACDLISNGAMRYCKP